jgi:hypothetical protein
MTGQQLPAREQSLPSFKIRIIITPLQIVWIGFPVHIHLYTDGQSFSSADGNQKIDRWILSGPEDMLE